MSIRMYVRPSAPVLIVALLEISSTALFAQEERRPNGMYGGCNLPESGFRRKSDHVESVERTLNEVNFIDVIGCRPADGPGGTFVVSCPSQTRYSYCLRNQNDGVGNHIDLGVVTDKIPPTCSITASLAEPLAQIDVTFRDQGSGISVIEFRGGSSNVQVHLPDFRDDDAPAVMTATKIKQGLPGRLPGILVTDGAGNVQTCSFEF